MWEKIRFISSSIFGFLWPLFKGCMVQAAPIAQEFAIAAVKSVASSYITANLSNDAKHATARELVVNQLVNKGVNVGTDIAVSTIDLLIKAAVKKMNGEQ